MCFGKRGQTPEEGSQRAAAEVAEAAVGAAAAAGETPKAAARAGCAPVREAAGRWVEPLADSSCGNVGKGRASVSSGGTSGSDLPDVSPLFPSRASLSWLPSPMFPDPAPPVPAGGPEEEEEEDAPPARAKSRRAKGSWC